MIAELQARLDQTDRIVAAATGQPWVVDAREFPHVEHIEEPEDSGLLVPVASVRSPTPNAEFIVHSRSELPKVNTALSKVVDHCRQQYEFHGDAAEINPAALRTAAVYGEILSIIGTELGGGHE